MANVGELTGAPAGRRYPHGAEVVEGGVSFRVWAPERKSVSVVLEAGGEHTLRRGAGGYFSAVVPEVKAGDRYRLRLDGHRQLLPDPASFLQPTGPKGPSEVVGPSRFKWKTKNWRGIRQKGQVLYEMHIGTFSTEGTFAGAIPHLEKLADLGITTIELMPLNEWVGDFGWGYDGILLYAPTHLYGSPDDVRAFIDAAHALGLGVILDVVYNHFGRGDQFAKFSENYFKPGAANEWGKTLSFDKRRSLGAREYVVANTIYWIAEFRFDGFRIDATQAIEDNRDDHVLAEIGRKARLAAGRREIVIMAENEPQDPTFVRDRASGGFGLDAVWNEDFHHVAQAAVTLSNEGYLHDQHGTPQEFVSMSKYGFLFQGQRYDWQDNFRGKAAFDLKPESFVHYIQNHDQVANTAVGRRFWDRTAPSRARALTAVFLLMPQTPILFQGQEFASSSPFFYFLDSDPELREEVAEGRVVFMSQFPGLRDPELLARLPDPADPQAFIRSKLAWEDWDRHPEVVALHRDLLRMRREEPAFAAQPHGPAGGIDGAVIGPDAFILRYAAEAKADERLLAVNFGRDLPIRSIADPLAAPPDGMEWSLVWSSSDARYGGEGRWPADLAERWTFRAETALIFAPVPRRPEKAFDKKTLDEWQHSIF